MTTVASRAVTNFRQDLTSVNDYDLVASAVSGLEGSFEELVRRYQRPISAYVYRMVGDYESALDLTQEIFIKVYNSLRRYRTEFKFSTWIYKIAHNSAVDHLRRINTREQSLISGPEGDHYELPVESTRPSPEQESERKERRIEIEAVVRTLPANYRELVIPSTLPGSDLRRNCRSYGPSPRHCEEPSLSSSRNDATTVRGKGNYRYLKWRREQRRQSFVILT
jgi:RNA polymerase sigma-70 factor (ECF subfamily)